MLNGEPLTTETKKDIKHGDEISIVGKRFIWMKNSKACAENPLIIDL